MAAEGRKGSLTLELPQASTTSAKTARELSPNETSTACSDESPLSPIPETSFFSARRHLFSRWRKEKTHGTVRPESHEGVVQTLEYEKRPKNSSRARFGLWGGRARRNTAQPSLTRGLGGGSKANIDEVFTEIRAKAEKEDEPSDIRIQSSPEPSPQPATPAAATVTTPSHHEKKQSVKKLPSLQAIHMAAIGKKAPPPPKVPRLELENDKVWVVEYFNGSKEPLKIETAAMTHNLHVTKCENVTLQVTNKINNIIIESCKKTNVILAGMISSVELIHCEKCKVQVIGQCPTVNMDNCAGINLYVNEEGRNVNIVTSKSSDMNVCFPLAPGEAEDDEQDYIELPVPHQFVHTIVGGKVTSKVSDLYG